MCQTTQGNQPPFLLPGGAIPVRCASERQGHLPHMLSTENAITFNLPNPNFDNSNAPEFSLELSCNSSKSDLKLIKHAQFYSRCSSLPRTSPFHQSLKSVAEARQAPPYRTRSQRSEDLVTSRTSSVSLRFI
jgi:hypothetical protein